MGEDFYLVSPKLNVMFYLGRHFSDEVVDGTVAAFSKYEDLFFEEEPVDVGSLKVKDFGEMALCDLLKIFAFYEDLAWRVPELRRSLFVNQFKGFDKAAFVIGEYANDFEERTKDLLVLD